MEDKRKEIVGNVIRIQRYHSPCGDLMLGSVEDFVTGRLKVIGIL